jgi:hypothetical protein
MFLVGLPGFSRSCGRAHESFFGLNGSFGTVVHRLFDKDLRGGLQRAVYMFRGTAAAEEVMV